ncbi:MAG: hypothetical protein MAG551_02028 [Candidatus Scalindua arabica]|uniref:Uncharacterized protein n=1 Tax=Candidatus Scalindua arabica TaxID=1127984 RepID=A0A941W3Q4_9BACT|nr:hypothetical protein [Candidatus Scalindua arabica]
MNIWQIDKLALFLTFFIPGFISIKIYDLLVPSELRNFPKTLFEAIGYSALNFAALSWLIYLIHSGNFYSNHGFWYFVFLFIIMFLAPISWPFLFIKLSLWKPVAKYIIHPIHKPWDYVFGKKESFWIIVHLKDGRKIGGKFDTNSFASSYPAEEQIYLEEVWKLKENGGFVEPIDRSQGILISSKEILSIEFFK